MIIYDVVQLIETEEFYQVAFEGRVLYQIYRKPLPNALQLCKRWLVQFLTDYWATDIQQAGGE